MSVRPNGRTATHVSRWVLSLLLICLLVASPRAARAQDDGARGYLLVPDGTAVLTIQGIAADSNQSVDPASVVPDGKINVRIALLQFTQTFSIGGQQASASDGG